MSTEIETPRRRRRDCWTPQEALIQKVVDEIEKLPASVDLTNAIQLLSQAQEKVADFVDSEEGRNWRIRTATPV